MPCRTKLTVLVGSVVLVTALLALGLAVVYAQGSGADLQITKTADDYSPDAGDTVEFTLIVTNTGTLTATNVVLEDFLPAGVTVESVSPSTGSCTTGTPGDPLAPLTCNLGEMPAGRTNVVRVTVRIDPDYVEAELPSDYRELENDALVFSETFDPNNDNNRAHVILDVYTSSLVWMWKTGPDYAMAGEEMSYHIRVRNLGPSTLQSFHFVDGLPPEVAYLGYEFEQGTGTCIYPWPMTGDHAVHCYLDDLAPGGVSIVHLRMLVNPDVPNGTSIWNNIDGWFADSDIDEVFGPLEWETEVTAGADLSIVKTSEPMKIYPGEQKLYHITVTNNGPAEAPEVIVTDTLPSWVHYEIDNDNCNLVTQDPDVLECHLGTIPPGQTAGFDISALVDPLAPAVEITNTAVVSMPYDTDRGNNIALATNLILPPIMADLELQKTASTSSPTAGTSMNFTLLVTNHGPVAAENVVVEDMLPEGLTVQSVSPGPWSCTTGTPGSEPLRCNLGTLGVGAPATVIVSVSIDPDYVGTLENDAVVSSDTHDQNNSNNRDFVIVYVDTYSSVFLKKGCGWGEEVLAGDELQYDILVRNEGPSTLHNFELWDLLPDDVTFLSYEILPGGGQCFYTPHLPPMHGGDGQGLHCYLGDVAPWETRIVFITVRINPDAPEGELTNEVTDWEAESSFSLQPPPRNRWCSNIVVNRADLSIRKTADPYKVFAGEQVRYDVCVTNNGPGNAFNVVVTDTLPLSVTYELDTDACLQVGATEAYTCALGTIPPGETRDFSIFARVEPGAQLGTVSNVAMVDSPSDPYNWPEDYNDRATAPNLIQGRADLRVQKFGKPEGEVRAGDKLTYTIIVDNLGTGYAHNVTLDDVMRSNGSFDLLEVTSDLPALCAPITGTFTHDLDLTCALTDTLDVKGPAPGSGRWMLTITAQANEPQSVNNRADADSSDFDPDMSNNWDIAEHEITAVADLELTKEAWGEMRVDCFGATELWLNEVAAGGTVTYTLTVSNTGPSTAENVVVLDEPLPFPDLLEIDVQSITPSQGSCQTGHIVDQRRLSCNLGTLSAGVTATVSFVAHVPSWVPDATLLVNDAQVYSDMFDNNNGNDVVTNNTIVSRVADLEVGKTQEPDTTLPGLEVVYTITVTNTGPSDAHGVLISDTLPFTPTTDITMECCASDDGQCDVPCEPPTCPAGECPWPEVDFIAQADIPAGQWVIYTLTAIPEWVPCDTITNTAEVVAPLSLMYEGDIDPCPDNDVATTTSDPECNFVPLALKEYPGPDSPP